MIYLVPLNPNFYWQKSSTFFMNEEGFFVHDLEKHQTKDVLDSHINGELTVIWRDWDDIIENHPKVQTKTLHFLSYNHCSYYPAF